MFDFNESDCSGGCAEPSLPSAYSLAPETCLPAVYFFEFGTMRDLPLFLDGFSI